MAPKKTVKAARKLSPLQQQVQEAVQATFVLKGMLKRTQRMYLIIGEKLAEVRDRKLYERLKYPDLEPYARERLGLGRSSLYQYLRIYDWAVRFHPGWLQPNAKGFIPELSDVGDLIWIETELAKPDLAENRRKGLEELQKKGLAGQLSQREVRKVRKTQNTVTGGLKQLISRLRQVRSRAGRLASMSPEVLQHLDAALQILVNDDALKVARLDNLWPSGEKWTNIYLA